MNNNIIEFKNLYHIDNYIYKINSEDCLYYILYIVYIIIYCNKLLNKYILIKRDNTYKLEKLGMKIRR